MDWGTPPRLKMVEEKIIDLADIVMRKTDQWEAERSGVDKRSLEFYFNNGYRVGYTFSKPVSQKEVIEALRMMASRIEEESK